MMRKSLTVILLMLVLMLAACGEGDIITGKIIAELENEVIKDGDATTILVSGENTGNLATDVELRVASESADMVKIRYPGNLTARLLPGEDTGTKRVAVQGFTSYSSTRYWIKTQLVEPATEKVLDERVHWITVNK